MPIKKDTTETTGAVKKFRKTFAKVAIPEKDPQLPNKLSSLTSDKVSDLQLEYTAWRELTEDLMVEALAEFTYAKLTYDYEYEKMLIMTSAKTVKEKEAIVSTDLRIHKLYNTFVEAELFYNLLTNKLESYTNCLTVISREITRRTNTP